MPSEKVGKYISRTARFGKFLFPSKRNKPTLLRIPPGVRLARRQAAAASQTPAVSQDSHEATSAPARMRASTAAISTATILLLRTAADRRW